MADVSELFKMMQRKCGFELVNHALMPPTRLRMLGRVPVDQAGMNMGNWKVLMDRLLTAVEQGRPWSVDISKSYFKKGGRLVYAWRLIFQAEAIEQQLADIINLTKTSPGSARPEPLEVRLYGVEENRNSTAGGKRGAGPLGSVMVGPMAVARKNMGG
jgi:hypothetical protein